MKNYETIKNEWEKWQQAEKVKDDTKIAVWMLYKNIELYYYKLYYPWLNILE